MDDQGRLLVNAGFVHPTLIEKKATQIEEGDTLRVPVAHLAVDDQRRFVVDDRFSGAFGALREQRARAEEPEVVVRRLDEHLLGVRLPRRVEAVHRPADLRGRRRGDRRATVRRARSHP